MFTSNVTVYESDDTIDFDAEIESARERALDEFDSKTIASIAALATLQLDAATRIELIEQQLLIRERARASVV